DAIILVGGATRMQIIKTIVGKMTGKLPYTNINPDEAIALGAAIQLELKEKNQALGDMVLTDVCPYTLGIETCKHLNDERQSGYFMPIIDRNTPIPVSRAEICTTVSDYQRQIRLKVYQGESRRVENNIMIGSLEIPIPPAPAGEMPIDVRFTYDVNGLLEVEVVVQKTNLKKRLVIKNTESLLSDEEIDERFKALSAIKIHPRDKAENRMLIARGERLYQETTSQLRAQIDLMLQSFESVLAGQNEAQITKEREKISKIFDQIEGRDIF
ncbi:MAG TPA: Hsp70 family protein, partial [Clostridia bacterium]|nr:Hsp70 family protein [Clostridia bacterium]